MSNQPNHKKKGGYLHEKDGVTSVSVNFLGQKMVLEAPDDKFDAVLAEAKALIKKIEPDVTVKA